MGRYDIEAQKGPGNEESRSHLFRVMIKRMRNEGRSIVIAA